MNKPYLSLHRAHFKSSSVPLPLGKLDFHTFFYLSSLQKSRSLSLAVQDSLHAQIRALLLMRASHAPAPGVYGPQTQSLSFTDTDIGQHICSQGADLHSSDLNSLVCFSKSVL